MPEINPKNKSLWTLTEILEDTSSPPEPIIKEGILLDGTILLIVGPAKSKKTFLTQNLALAIASGTDFAGFKITKPKKVLYYLAEGGYFPNRKRLQKMAENISPDNMDNFLIEFPTYILLNHQESYEVIYKTLKKWDAEVVIFDPLIRFHDAEENSANGISEVFSRIRQLIEQLGISVILVHHTGKVETRGGRGSSVITGEYDSCLTIHKAQDDCIRLTYDMRHVETPPSNQIRFNSDTFWFENKDGILELLESSGGIMDKKELFEKYKRPRPTTYKHLKKLKQTGKVGEEDGVLSLEIE